MLIDISSIQSRITNFTVEVSSVTEFDIYYPIYYGDKKCYWQRLTTVEAPDEKSAIKWVEETYGPVRQGFYKAQKAGTNV